MKIFATLLIISSSTANTQIPSQDLYTLANDLLKETENSPQKSSLVEKEITPQLNDLDRIKELRGQLERL